MQNATELPTVVSQLISQGVKVVPIISGTKQPCINEWEKDASSDLNIIEGWAKEYQGCGWGVVTTPDTVFSVDDDADVLHDWLKQRGLETHTTLTSPATETSPAHRGYIFKQTNASRKMGTVTQPQSGGKFSVRGDRHQAVVYGLHPKGHNYETESSAPIIEAPDSLIEYLRSFIPEVELPDPVSDEKRAKSFDETKAALEAWGLPYGPDKVSGSGLLYVNLLNGCPLHEGKHTQREAMVGVGDNGGKRYSCFRCDAAKGWKAWEAWDAFRAFIDPEKKFRFSAPEIDYSLEFHPSPKQSVPVTTTITVEDNSAPTPPTNHSKTYFMRPRVPGKRREFVFGPKPLDFQPKPGGWFSRGVTHLV